MLTRRLLIKGLLLSIFFTLQCTVDKDTLIGPTEDPTKYIIFKSLTSTKNQLFSSGDSCTIQLNIVDPSDQPKEGIVINFSAMLGTITAQDTSDSFGVALAQYTSGEDAGIEKITFSAGVKEDSLFLLIIDRTATVSISSDTTEILADGESTVKISATVTDEQGAALTGITIYFSTNEGQITSNGMTDENGEFYATLTSSPDSFDVYATVKASLQPFESALYRLPNGVSSEIIQQNKQYMLRSISMKTSSSLKTQRSTDFKINSRPITEPYPTRKLTRENQLDSLIITFKGITVNISANPTQIYADGVSTSTITIGLQETTTGNPIPNQAFTLSTTNGIISPGGTTDATGTATATLTSSTNPGTSIVTATAGVSNTTTVDFLPTTPTDISLISASSNILADGESFTTITVEVTDTLGGPVSGVMVNFTTTLGSLGNENVVTDENGEATVTLTSIADTVDQITNLKGEITSTSNVKDSTDITFRGIELTITPLDTLLIADGVSSTQITSQLQEQTNGNPLIDRTIFWGTTLGTIPASSITNEVGQTTTTLLTGTESGTAVVTVIFGDTLTSSASIIFYPLTDSTIILSWVNPNTDGDGLGDGTDTLAVSALFVDEYSNPLVGDTLYFSLNPNTVGTIESPKITDNDGVAHTPLRYSSQFEGVIVRVWVKYLEDGIEIVIGYMDITLPPIN